MGVPANTVLVVREGSVSLTFGNTYGDARIARIVGQGEIFGLDSLLSHKTRAFNAIAREDCKVCFMGTDAFLDLIRLDRDRLWQLAMALVSRSIDGEIEKLEISGQRMLKRLQYVLFRFSRNRLADEKHGQMAGIKQWEIAQFIGTSEEAVSRGLKALSRSAHKNC